jgi:hypothetical protein
MAEDTPQKDIWAELEIIKQNIKRESGQGTFNTSSDKINDIMKDIQSEKITALKRVIDEINELIAERRALSEKIILEINDISAKVDSMLMQIPSASPENYRERMTLKEKQIMVEETKVKERVECWRDVANLKRELRERIKEFVDQEGKNSIMDGILLQKPKQ